MESSRYKPEPAGLGTKWGETRDSEVHESSFERGSSSPAASTSVYYSNEAPAGRKASQPFSIGNGIATIAIRSKSGFGGNLPAYRESGSNHVVGTEGQRYSIEIKNRTPSTIEVVLSVDGLDVLDGRSASYGKRGYIIKPHGRVEVDGFRKNYSEVAAFRFSSIPKSYAAKKHGDTRNVGVIGAAVFTKKQTWNSRPNAFPEESGRFATPPRR